MLLCVPETNRITFFLLFFFKPIFINSNWSFHRSSRFTLLFQNLRIWLHNIEVKTNLSQLSTWKGCDSQISTDFAFCFIEKMEAPGCAQILTSNHPYTLTCTHSSPVSPSFRFLGLPDPSLFWMDLSSPFSPGPSHRGMELAANESSTLLPTTLIPLLPPHGHIHWESLRFPYCPLTPQPTVAGTAMGTDLLEVTADFLVEEPSPHVTFGQHLTAGHSHHGCPDIHPPASPRTPSQTSLEASPVNAGVPVLS